MQLYLSKETSNSHRKVGDLPFKNTIRMVKCQCGKQMVTGLILNLNFAYYKDLLW
jgi:hypothetical protein